MRLEICHVQANHIVKAQVFKREKTFWNKPVAAQWPAELLGSDAVHRIVDIKREIFRIINSESFTIEPLVSMFFLFV